MGVAIKGDLLLLLLLKLLLGELKEARMRPPLLRVYRHWIGRRNRMLPVLPFRTKRDCPSVHDISMVLTYRPYCLIFHRHICHQIDSSFYPLRRSACQRCQQVRFHARVGMGFIQRPSNNGMVDRSKMIDVSYCYCGIGGVVARGDERQLLKVPVHHVIAIIN